MDLFFWDSTKTASQGSIQSLHKLLSLLSERKIPLVLGEIPILLPQYQPSLFRLNQELHDACRRYENCHLLPLNKILSQIVADGFLYHQGQKYHLEELIPDGLHLVKPASEYLAEQILKLLMNEPEGPEINFKS